MTIKALPFFTAALLAAALTTPAFTHAQFNQGFEETDQLAVDSEVTDFGGDPVQFIKAILNVVLSVVGIVAAAVLVYGGIMYVTSAGDEDKAKRGKWTILYAVIGLLLLAASALVVNVVINTFFLPNA